MGSILAWNLTTLSLTISSTVPPIRTLLILALRLLLAVVMVIPSQYQSSCHAHNSTTPGSPSGHQDVGSPYFLDTRKEIRITESKMAILPCSVRNLGDRRIVWRKVRTDKFLSVGSLMFSEDLRLVVELRVRDGVTSADLIVRKVTLEDAGIYECQITSVERLIRNVELRVFQIGGAKPRSPTRTQVATTTPTPTTTTTTTTTVTPSTTTTVPETIIPSRRDSSIIVTRPNERVFEAGDTIRLECNTSVSKDGPIHRNLEWSKDGRPAHSTKRVIVTHYHYQTDGLRVSQLYIDRADVTDSGEYRCHTKEMAISVTDVLVLPRPDRLQSDTAVSDNGGTFTHPHTHDQSQSDNDVDEATTLHISLTLLILHTALCLCFSLHNNLLIY